jgi:hypothetical protein
MKHNFKPYLNPVFIETGSYVGEGIQAALDAGFKRVISIELSEYYHTLCKIRFPKAEVIFGDSTEMLPKILENINEKCTFWLDGHWCGDISACGPNPVPLMEELLAIKNHHIKDHTILIDDMRLLRTHDAEWKDLKYGVEDLEKVIRSMNPKYNIVYDKGLVKNDILIATV